MSVLIEVSNKTDWRFCLKSDQINPIAVPKIKVSLICLQLKVNCIFDHSVSSQGNNTGIALQPLTQSDSSTSYLFMLATLLKKKKAML